MPLMCPSHCAKMCQLCAFMTAGDNQTLNGIFVTHINIFMGCVVSVHGVHWGAHVPVILRGPSLRRANCRIKALARVNMKYMLLLQARQGG